MPQPIEPWNPDRWDHPDETFFLIDESGWAVPFEHGTERTPALASRRAARGRRTAAPRWAAGLASVVLFAAAPSAVAHGQDAEPAPAPSAEETVTGNVNIGVYGDSYTAGEGADDNQGADEYVDSRDQRHQSTHAPAAVAGSLIEGANPGLEVTMPFAASSGAVSADVHSPQQRAVDGTGHANPPQMGQVPADMDGVVVGLGGNDAKFADVMFDGAVMARDQEGMTARIGRILADDPAVTIEPISPEEMQAQIDEARATGTQPLNLAARLAMTYQDIRAQHPDAAMVVVNYPVAVDPDVEIDAPMGFGFNTDELAAIQQFANEVNAQIATAVENCGCGAALADVSDAFEGHEAGTADSDIVGLMRDEEDEVTHRQRERLHPNMSGAEKIGRTIADVMARELGVEPPAADADVDMGAHGVDLRVSPAPAQPDPVGARGQAFPPPSQWPGATSTEIDNVPPSHPDLPAESSPAPTTDPVTPTAPSAPATPSDEPPSVPGEDAPPPAAEPPPAPGIAPPDDLPVIPTAATPDDAPTAPDAEPGDDADGTPVLVVPGAPNQPSDPARPADGTPAGGDASPTTPAAPETPPSEGSGDDGRADEDPSDGDEPADGGERPVDDVVRPDEDEGPDDDPDSDDDTGSGDGGTDADRPVDDAVRPDDRSEPDDEPDDEPDGEPDGERVAPRAPDAEGTDAETAPSPSSPPSVASDPPAQPTPPAADDAPQVPDAPNPGPDRSDPPGLPTPPAPDSLPADDGGAPSGPQVDSSSPLSPTAPDVDDDVPEPPSPGNSNDDWDGPPEPPSPPAPPAPDSSPSVDTDPPSPPSPGGVAVSVSDGGGDSDSGWGSSGGAPSGGGGSGSDSSDGPGPGEGSMDAAAGSSSSGGSGGGESGSSADAPGPGEGSMDAAAGSSQGSGSGTSGDGIGLVS